MADSQYIEEYPVLQLPLPLFANQIDPPLRDNRDTMAYPFFSLEKHKRTSIEYRDDKVSIFIDAPERYGVATIWDWDLIITLCPQLNDAQNLGKTPSPCLSFSPHQILKQMGRGVGGKDYKELVNTIRRLRATIIVTNIRINDEAGEERPFSWLQNYKIPKKYHSGFLTPKEDDGEPDHSKTWHIQIASWIYEKIINKKDLITIDEGYFTLKSGIERWLYLLAKKELQTQKNWVCSAQKLYEISNLQQTKDRFINQIQNLTKKQNLLDVFVKHENKQGQEDLSLVFSC